MNHPTVPRPEFRRRSRPFLALILCLALAAVVAPSAHAAIGGRHYLPSLSHEEAFADACSAATDSEGDLYVGDFTGETVFVFSPDGDRLAEFEAAVPCGDTIAIASDGDVYVVGEFGEVTRYAPTAYPPVSGTTYQVDTTLNGTGALVEEGATGVAVDPADQDVYVAEGEHISSYTSAGVPISETIGEGLAVGGAEYAGVGVLGSNGDIYATAQPLAGENEVQNLTITGATGGTYELSFEGQTTGWQGSGTLAGSTTISGVTTTVGALVEEEEISGPGIAAGTVIEDFDPTAQTITLSQPASGSGAAALSADLPYTAPARTIKKALGELSTIGPLGVNVTGEGTSLPIEREIKFQRGLAERNVEPIGAVGTLTGAGAAIAVSTVNDGTPEQEMVYVLDGSGSSIKASFDGSGSAEGSFAEGEAPAIAVDQSNGHVLVSDIKEHGVVDEFDATGTFVSQLGPNFGSQEFARGGQFGLAVDNGSSIPTQGDVYVASPETVYAFGPRISGFALTVEKGTHGGSVASTPSGLTCGPTCSQESAVFEEGQAVILKATGEVGSRFVGWEAGDCDRELGPGDDECEVVVDGAVTVKALFVREFGLTVLAPSSGAGTVTSSPAGIDCRGGGATGCEAEFEEGKTVTLTATAASGFRFAGWSNGACQETLGTGGVECKFAMTAAKVVTPKFVHTFSLTVGTVGSGAVASSPAGIDCGATCVAEYAEGETVTLTATAASGSHLVGWSGGGCVGTGSCVVTVKAATEVTATFAADPTPPSTEEKQPQKQETPPPPPPPPPTPTPAAGAPRLAPIAPVNGRKAALKITCSGAGGCAGTLKLTAKVKGKTVFLGAADYAVGAGKSKTIAVGLDARARKLLAGGGLKVKVSGPGLSGTVTLRPKAK